METVLFAGAARTVTLTVGAGAPSLPALLAFLTNRWFLRTIKPAPSSYGERRYLYEYDVSWRISKV